MKLAQVLSAVGFDRHSRIATLGSACTLMILVNALLIICSIIKGHLAASAILIASLILHINIPKGSKDSNG